MRKIIFLIILISASFIAAQTKYMIYFKDKGISPSASLQKTTSLYKMAEQQLSPKAIERRKQVMGEDNYITYEDIPLNENYLQQIETRGIKIENKLKWFNAVSAYLTDDQLNSIKSLSIIEKVEKVHVFKSRNGERKFDESPNNSSRPLNKTTSTTSLNYGPSLTQNALSDIPVVHDLGINGKDVYVGILDNGFSYKSHNSLKNLKVLKEYDYVQKDNDAQNQSGHGQAVFSIMAGYDPGNIIGPAFGANFFLAKTENDIGEKHVEEDNYAAALQDMEMEGVQITSSSLGYADDFTYGDADYTFADMNGQTTIVARALNICFDRGVSTFTAAGNERGNTWNHIVSPADGINTIAVGAVNSDKSLAFYSSPGPTADGRIKPEICAMGTYNYHADVFGGYSNSGYGTSLATPIAAGIAALLKSTWTHLTNVQIRKIFLECGDNSTSPNNDRGWGLISAKKVISYPNLSKTNGAYNVLNKIFIDPNGVNSSSVRLNYSIGGASFQSTQMNYDNIMKYNFTFPVSSDGTSVEFYFTYQTTGGTSIREPEGNLNYKFPYGSMLISGVEETGNGSHIPSQFYLEQNYPNPFNPSTVISYKLADKSKVSLRIYDILGREVAILVNEEQQPGIYKYNFNGQQNSGGRQLTSSVYFYRLQTNNYTATKKMILIK